MYRAVLGETYHDDLNAGSFSREDYDRQIVDRGNKLCEALGLQYLWSNMVVDGQIVFTASVSPGHDVTQADHAKFFDVHNDPHAFDTVLRTMKTDYSSFYNEWGHGRMVLVPFTDQSDRPYVLGASVDTNDVYDMLQQVLLQNIVLALLVLAGSVTITVLISRIISRPIIELTAATSRIWGGDLRATVRAQLTKRKDEIGKLAQGFNSMAQNLSKRDQALIARANDLEKSQAELKKALVTAERVSRVMVGRELEIARLRKQAPASSLESPSGQSVGAKDKKEG
jgi:methyl-accepting chemotaxis protein